MASRASAPPPPRRGSPKTTRVGDQLDRHVRSQTPFAARISGRALRPGRRLPGHGGVARGDAPCPPSGAAHAAGRRPATRCRRKPRCRAVWGFASARKGGSPRRGRRCDRSAPRCELLPRQPQTKEVPAGQHALVAERQSMRSDTCPIAGSGAGTAFLPPAAFRGQPKHGTRAPRGVCGESRGSAGVPAAAAAPSGRHVGRDPHASRSRNLV